MSMRVAMNLLWCRPGVGGSEEYLTRQLAGIAANGHPVEIEVFAPRGFARRLPAVAGAFRVHEAPSDCERRPGRVLLEHTWLAARTSAFDIVHHGGGTVPVRGNRRTLLTVHDVQWVDYPHYVRPVKRAYLRTAVPRSLARAAHIATPTSFVKSTLERHFGTPAGRVSVVRHGLEPEMDAPTPPAEVRRRYALGDGPVIVFPAITHPHKNHGFLLQLLAHAGGAWSDPALRVVFAGSAGHAEGDVRAMVASLGLGERVVMPGRVPAADRNGLLAIADAMVFPSEYEGFGAPLIEAMRMGAPVIASDRASIPEVVGGAGLVLPLRADAWAGALDEVRGRRDALRAAGTARAATYTAELSARDLVDAYGRVLA
jgi:alpha-1,3-rhamnosyl/mannosyltransferase